MPDTPIRIALIKRIHLFRGLSDEQIASVVESMQEETHDEAKTIFEQGTSTDTFFIIFSGSVDIFRATKRGEQKVASLSRGDYFGERSLLKNRSHNATVRVTKGTVLLKLYRDKFRALMKTIPDLRINFETMSKSRELALKMHFSWLNQNEVIYFLARKHDFFLYQSLIGPFLGLMLTVSLIGLGITLSSYGLLGVGGFFLILVAFWGLWIYIDWSNDYYIVTNQRVIIIEKVVAMHDSREEALMSTILSVNTETNQLGRIFRYGTIVVRTYTGELRMRHAPRPKQAAAMIEEYWQRSKEVMRQNDEEIMKNAIRRKLGIIPPAAPAPEKAPAPSLKAAPKPTLGSAIGEFIKEIFYVRKIANGTVTYHKHWLILLRDIILQTLLLFGLIAVYPLWYYFFGATIPLALGSIIAFLIVVDLVWWVYGFLDWGNDKYMVTPEQIVDIYRVPFGDEDRKSAPLENILSTEYRRAGVIGLLFNFGVVNVKVGGTSFDFVDVADPPSVQKDIVERMSVRIQKKRETDSAVERDRMADWLAMYHRTMGEIEKQDGQTRKPDSG